MKSLRVVLAIMMLFLSPFVWGQSPMLNFTSEGQILRYLEENVANLDPVEGKYDTQFSMKTNSPFVENREYACTYYIVRNPSSRIFTIYIRDEVFNGICKAPHMRIESIGETNAYRLYWENSSNRAYLEKGLRLAANIKLSKFDAKEYAGNPRFAYTIVLGYDFVKSYPTPSMYANATEVSNPTSWSGTGFALENGCVATNYHVIENAKSIKVQGIRGSFNTEYNATVISKDKFNDLAIIKIDDSRFEGFGNIPYCVKTNTSEVGEDVFVLGYPLTSTMGDEIKLTTGVISSKTGFQGDVSLYQISAPVQPGNSGGPLFDGNGNLIGIVNSKHRGAENVGYAVKASYLNNLAESISSISLLPTHNSVSGTPLSSKVKSLKNFVFMITCSSISSGSSTYNSNSVRPDNATSSSADTGSGSSTYNSNSAHSDSGTSSSDKSGSSTYNSNSAHSDSDTSSSDRICYYPSVSNGFDEKLTLISVIIKSNETVLTFSYKNDLAGGWMNIDKNAYIVANGSKYTLTRPEGIVYSPGYTNFSCQGESKIFRLHFQAIPETTTSIDFVENKTSQWRLYGISLKL